MAFSSGNSGGPMADINVTPLVDVMLVLLIIFIITAPLMSHKVKVDLPEANLIQKPEDAEKRPNRSPWQSRKTARSTGTTKKSTSRLSSPAWRPPPSRPRSRR
jgi:hypothetical protein